MRDQSGLVSRAGVGGEIMPWSTPVSLTFGWKHFELDTITGESDTLQVGVRWNFGSETLRDRDNATPFHLDTGFNDRLFGFF